MTADPILLVMLAAMCGAVAGGLLVHWCQPYCCRMQPGLDDGADAEADK